MVIGNVNVDNILFLAPMAGVTDLTFRLICKEQGCGLTYTEMVSAKGLYYNSIRTYELLKIDDREHPIGVQIFGSDPNIMGKMAAELSKTDIDLIDINMGCPAPKITKNGEGSALMREPDRVKDIVEAVVSSSTKPITVKMRKGWDKDNVNAPYIAKLVEEAGASAVTVHGRTREDFYSGRADWDVIKEVKKCVDIPVIGNGDIFTPEDAKQMLDYTGCDAVMIGRGAQGNPWIFKRTLHYLETGELLSPPTWEERIEMAIRHLEMALKIKDERIVIPEMRKHIGWYLKGIKGAANIRAMVNRMDTADEVRALLNSII
ncbi:MAG TPA: tRNA dihydrouridine synthase DusB [Clostridiales bacterium]|nr:tRNA dihydrouridine synthase DusB [Clostridiales bacterium]